MFDFDFDDDKVDVGSDLPLPGSGTKSKPPGSKGSGAKGSGTKSKKAPASPPPPAGSDSDVRLVADGSDVTFSVPKEGPLKPPDSDVKISPDPLKPRTGLHPQQPSSGGKRPSELAIGSGVKAKAKPGSSATKPVSPRPGSGPQPADSGVRLVPLDDDSDVKLLGSSDDAPLGAIAHTGTGDSNVRLDRVDLPPADSAEGNLMLTDEIDLDAEMQKLDKLKKSDPPTKLKPKSELKLPAGSPFELSDSELAMPSELKEGTAPKTPRTPKKDDSSDYDLATQSPTEGSSDFDLVSADDGSILLEGDSKDFSLAPGEESALEDDPRTELSNSASGISLSNPVDAGISLEEGGSSEDSVEFDLSLEAEDTPRPAKSGAMGDSDSEFELTAQKTPRPRKSAPAAGSESEEFDLSLDADSDSEAAALNDSGDSNFELNLDGSGGEAVVSRIQ